MIIPDQVKDMVKELCVPARTVPSKTQLNHLFDDGSRVIVYKDKDGNLWFQWREKGKQFTPLVRIKTLSIEV